MEVKEKSKKRELIKSIAIVFLAVLLVLTFFSNTIMNRSLPEVATRMISGGTIDAKIRGSGTVSANESYEVILDQTREVRTVCVRVGDTVNQGDLLFVLGDVESQELKNAQEQLAQLNLNYQKQVLSLSKEYTQEDRTIQKIREDLEEAIALRDANPVTDMEVSWAKGDLAAAESQLEQIEVLLEELNAALQDDDDYQQALADVTEWTGEVSAAESAVEGYEQQLEQLENTGSVDLNRQIEDAKAAVKSARRVLQSDWLAYESDYNDLIAEVLTAYPNVANVFDETTDADGLFRITDEQQKYIDAYLLTAGEDSTYAAAYDTLIADYEDLLLKQTTLERLLEDEEELDNGDQWSAISRKLRDAEDELEYAEDMLWEAERALEAAEAAQGALRQQIKNYEASKRQQEALIRTLGDTVSNLEERQKAAKDAADTIKTKEQELADALSGKDIDKQLDNLDLQAMRAEIEKQEALVEKYRQDTIDTEIKANVSGTISAINVSAGKDTMAGEAMAVIDVVDRGYTMKVPVTTEQARQVKIGDTASVTNYYWGNDLVATLEAVTADPSNPGRGKLLVFRITGTVDPGTTLNLSIGQRSANFDTIIPKSALREDANGSFVLVVMAKNTPLGNRYTAARVDVQVLASDDTNAAVSGLSAGDYVITTSSAPLDAGTQVRMVENP